MIDGEQMTYSGKQAAVAAAAAGSAAVAQPGMLLQVQRGVSGTTPAPHEAGAALVLVNAGLACVGDCDGMGSVTVDEILTLINMALGTETQLSACPHGFSPDITDISQVNVAVILVAVNNALDGCPS